MASSKFEGKTKADLSAIALMSGLLKTTQTQRMKKDELLAFLEQAEATGSLKDKPIDEKKKTEKKSGSGSLTADESATPKRGRGRPRKNPLPEQISGLAENSLQNNQQPTAEEAEAVLPVKRKRGRPRKNPLPQQTTEVVQGTNHFNTIETEEDRQDAEYSAPKRGRGRPRKEIRAEHGTVTGRETEQERQFQTRSNRDQESERRPSDRDNRSRNRYNQSSDYSESLRGKASSRQTEQEFETEGYDDLGVEPYRSNRKRNQRPFNKQKQVSDRNAQKNRQKSPLKSEEDFRPYLKDRTYGEEENQPLPRPSRRSKPAYETEAELEGVQEELEQGLEPRRFAVKTEAPMETGVLEIMPEGYGFLRVENYIQSPNDLYLPPQYIRRFHLRNGDLVSGPSRVQNDGDRFKAIYYVKSVNGRPPEEMIHRPHFDRLTPIYPDERLVLETGRNELSTRIIDLMAPIGKGQRGMIVSPPKAGKTTLLQKIANAISANNPQSKLIVLLIDERPEEVTDMQRSINGEVVYSTFDRTPENHVKITELVLERAERLVEMGEDVIILLDSITRMSRAYNLTITPTGRTLSGGLDPGALYGPKRFFGAARNIENGGSLTVIATALIDTGSRMDEVIFEEFKGTGNMEVYLDRKLSEKRIFPAIDINRSGTRREELLLSNQEIDAVWAIRKAFSTLETAPVTEMIINLLMKTSSNSQFISSVNVTFNDKRLYEAMRGAPPAQKDKLGSNGNTRNGNNGGTSNSAL